MAFKGSPYSRNRQLSKDNSRFECTLNVQIKKTKRQPMWNPMITFAMLSNLDFWLRVKLCSVRTVIYFYNASELKWTKYTKRQFCLDWTIHFWVICPKYFPSIFAFFPYGFPNGKNTKIKTKEEYKKKKIFKEMIQQPMPLHKIARTNHKNDFEFWLFCYIWGWFIVKMPSSHLKITMTNASAAFLLPLGAYTKWRIYEKEEKTLTAHQSRTCCKHNWPLL